MNNARVENSERLRRVLGMLEFRGRAGATSLELSLGAHTVAPGTCVSELRAQGYVVDCKREGNVWRYTLRERPANRDCDVVVVADGGEDLVQGVLALPNG